MKISDLQGPIQTLSSPTSNSFSIDQRQPMSPMESATTALSSSQKIIDASKVFSTQPQNQGFTDTVHQMDPTGAKSKALITGALPTVGAIGGGLLGGAIGGLAASPTIVGIPAGVLAGASVGAGLGSGVGEEARQALNNEQLDAGKIGKTALGFGATEAIGGPVTALAGKGLGSLATKALGKASEFTGLADFLANRAVKKATDAVVSTAQTMTKGEQTAATEAGRLKPTITGAGKFMPSPTEENAGNLLVGKVTGNPVKDVPIIQKEIATRGTAAEQFLGMNGRPVTPDEATTAFDAAKTKAARYLTPDQLKNYDHTMAQFQAELKDVAGTDPIAQNTGTYYKALKNFEQNVTARLRQGNEALLTDAGSAQLQAAKDVRTTIRDLIGQKNPEFKQQMYDLASLYDAQDNVVAKAVAHDTFAKAHPIISKTLKYGAEITGAGAIYEGARKMGLPLPGF